MLTLKSAGYFFKRVFQKIPLIDKCLIVIMLLLLIQSAHCLITNIESMSKVNTIDIIIRTATASIFGYFLSSNFIRNYAIHPKDKIKSRNLANIKIQEKGKSTDQLKDSEYHTGNSEDSLNVDDEKEDTLTPENRLQIIITTAIAVFCLLVLITVRNTSGFSEENLSPSSLATISQFRDLISGCIGFLIGVPATKK